MAAPEDQYRNERNAGYDRILSVIQSHIDALKPEITVDLTLLAPGNAREAAERDVWTLFKAGVQHLKNGGQMDEPGSFAAAVGKACLRSAPMASTLGLKPAAYEETYNNYEFDTGTAEAFFWSRRMVEAAVADLPKSRDLIRRRLAFDKPLAAEADKTAPALADAELSAVFGAALKSQQRDETGDDPFIATLRKQTVLSFNLITSAYPVIADTLMKEIITAFTPPSPKPAHKGQTFEF